MSKKIFTLSAEGYWFASVFCINMMFCHIGADPNNNNNNESNPNNNNNNESESGIDPAMQQMYLKMSMAAWHECVLIPMAKEITKQHKIPPFAEKALKDVNHFSSCNTAIALHMSLLFHASTALIKQCRKKMVGHQTLEEIEKWFQLISQTASSDLFKAAPDGLKGELQKLIKVKLPTKKDCNGRQEHPHFSHEILFIQIAHMIWMYCKNNLNSDFPHLSSRDNPNVTGIVVDDSYMTTWERLSGRLLEDIFCLNDFNVDSIHFDFLDLPYEELIQEMDDKIRPSVGKWHEEVLNLIFKTVQRNIMCSVPSEYHTEDEKLINMLKRAEEFKKQYTDVLKNRTKQRTHFLKNRKTQKKYKSIPKHHYQRDRFIMGRQSYFVKNATIITPQGKKRSHYEFVYPEYVDAPAEESEESSSEESEIEDNDMGKPEEISSISSSEESKEEEGAYGESYAL